MIQFLGAQRSYNSRSAGSKAVKIEGSERTIVFLLGVPLVGVKVVRKAEREAESLKRNEADSESVEVGESFPGPN
jgi:hypothetical protein